MTPATPAAAAAITIPEGWRAMRPDEMMPGLSGMKLNVALGQGHTRMVYLSRRTILDLITNAGANGQQIPIKWLPAARP